MFILVLNKAGISSYLKVVGISAYINILKNISQEFDSLNISYYYLDGSTKVKDRNDLVHKFNNDKTRKIVKKVVSYVVLSVLIVFLGLSIYSKANNDVMLFGNSALLTVASGSMSYKNEENTYLDFNNLDNQFQTYDVIKIQKVKELKYILISMVML